MLLLTRLLYDIEEGKKRYRIASEVPPASILAVIRLTSHRVPDVKFVGFTNDIPLVIYGDRAG